MSDDVERSQYSIIFKKKAAQGTMAYLRKRLLGELNYCRDRGAELSMRTPPDPSSSSTLNDICARIDRVDGTIPTERQLRCRIIEAECEVLHGKNIVFPQCLDYAMRPFLVERLLEEKLVSSTTTKAARLAQVVCNSYRKVLATLIKSGCVHHIANFVEAGFDDSSLPLEYLRRHSQHGAISKHPGYRWITFQDADKIDWDNFCFNQQAFLTPFFGRPVGDVYHYQFSRWDTIPIKKASESEQSAVCDSTQPVSLIVGGHSTVQKIQLNPLCIGFGNYKYRSKNDSFALKMLKDGLEFDDFLSEVNFWRLFHSRGGDELSLTPLMCTWEMPNEQGRTCYYLLFPWASGDLRTLWERQPTEPRFSSGWLLSQCWKLAETLSYIHQDSPEREDCEDPETVFGRHGDIKPGNILWFGENLNCSEGGSLVLADFGVSKVHRAVTRSQSGNINIKHSPPYRSPEYDVKGQNVGRKADIWALGRTWIELLTWFIMGSTVEYESFVHVRVGAVGEDSATLGQDCYFTTLSDGHAIKVRDEVINWVGLLLKSERCIGFLPELLKYILDKMLTVEPQKRDEAYKVASTLKQMLNDRSTVS